MYKPLPLNSRPSGQPAPTIRHPRRLAWAGNLLALLLVGLLVLAVEYGPDLLAGWIF